MEFVPYFAVQLTAWQSMTSVYCICLVKIRRPAKQTCTQNQVNLIKIKSSRCTTISSYPINQFSVQDLSGWHITSIGCSNTSVVISADDTLIAWGASPTFGELVSSRNAFQKLPITTLKRMRCFFDCIYTGFGRLTEIKHHTERGESHGRHENSAGDYGSGTYIATG